MRRQIMSMLAGLVLVSGTLLGAGPAVATAEPPGARPSASEPPATGASASKPSASEPPASKPSASEPPAEFGSDWHDPVTAAPPVTRPDTRSCEVTVAQAQFRDFTPYRGSYTPPKGCGDRWSKVVLRLDGNVKGRQYDRLGHLAVGGVEILRTSTPQPSPDGIAWSVEKDVTRYSELLRGAQPVEMLIGNVVDETYTGIIDVKVTLTFYAAHGAARPAAVPDRVLALNGTSLTTPRNSERIVAEVYATGSGGGCEEYWYLTVPDSAPYSCKATDGPYREVQIRVDGRLAGIAAPFPTVWTGGWSNPFLWYVIPGPRAFDIKPLQYDLTPFAALLNDGREHRVEVSVAGVPAGRPGWSTPTNVLVWQDEASTVVTGGLTRHHESTPVASVRHTPGPEHRLDTKGGHRLTVSGYLDTSHGRVTTTVSRAVGNASVHRWTEDEKLDALKATWTDDETVTTGGRTTVTHRVHTMDGTTTLGAGDRLRTVLTLGDTADTAEVRDGRRLAWSRLDDRYTGDATYTADVPRDQRHAVGRTAERYRLHGSEGCYDRSLTTVQGMLTEDRRRC